MPLGIHHSLHLVISALFLCWSCSFITGQSTKYSDTTYAIIESKNSGPNQGIRIENSYPKGGVYIDPTGNKLAYGIFWTRVINETASSIEMKVEFPAESYTMFPQPEYYFKLFLPPGPMSREKMSAFDYGATGLKSFLDTGINTPTSLYKTIDTGDDLYFHVGLIFKLPDNGPVRTGLIMKENDLFYGIRIARHLNTTLIPCGFIQIKD